MSNQAVLELVRANKPSSSDSHSYAACPSCHHTFPMLPSIGEVMTVREVAKLMKMSAFRVSELARTGKIPAGVAFKFGHQWRFRVDALRKWMDQGGTAAS